MKLASVKSNTIKKSTATAPAKSTPGINDKGVATNNTQPKPSAPAFGKQQPSTQKTAAAPVKPEKAVQEPQVVKVTVEEAKVIEEIKEPPVLLRQPVKGLVTVKYNHYKESFPIVDGVLLEADIEEQYCLSYAWQGVYYVNIRDENNNPEKRYQSKHPDIPKAWVDCEDGKTYVIDVEQDTAKNKEVLATFKTIPIRRLHKELEMAQEHGKYCLVFDMNGNCNVYFDYKATMKDFHKEMLAYAVGKKTKTDALDVLRQGLVYAMRIGDTFVINVDKSCPDFVDDFTHDEIFPTEKIFDWPFWCSREPENYMKIVKEEEDHDLLGNKKMYAMRDKF